MLRGRNIHLDVEVETRLEGGRAPFGKGREVVWSFCRGEGVEKWKGGGRRGEEGEEGGGGGGGGRREEWERRGEEWGGEGKRRRKSEGKKMKKG